MKKKLATNDTNEHELRLQEEINTLKFKDLEKREMKDRGKSIYHHGILQDGMSC